MITLGITGPTGSGKSIVAEIFAQQGFNIIDADKIARLIMQKGSDCLKQVAEVFGEDIIKNDGELDRSLLARRAFCSEQSTNKLNSITHPAIMREIKSQLDKSIKSGCKLNAIDAPLLFEAHGERLCTATLCVIGDTNERIKRIMERDNISREAAQMRCERQKSAEYYKSRCDYVITNNGNLELLRKKVFVLIQRLTEGDR